MKTYVVSIQLVIPDNTAGTALATLRRLGVSVTALERADIWEFDCPETLAQSAFMARVEHIEAIYNLNKHRILAVQARGPRSGEVWVRALDEGVPADAADVMRQLGVGASAVRHRTAWRLLEGATPAPLQLVRRAAATLLCNPAFQEASFAGDANLPE